MLSALLRPNNHQHSTSSSVFGSPAIHRELPPTSSTGYACSVGEDNEDGECETTPLLPLFAAHLDSIPVYTIVHSIREEICSTVDTTLTWEQLRTPQVSSFLVKPIHGKLKRMEGNISKGIIYSLMVNCLQFRKEVDQNPGNAGCSATRALLCEVIAIRFLREFSARDLIDVLSYDFYPLQGMPPTVGPSSIPRTGQVPMSNKASLPATRISALEIAIRAQAKKFLSQPVVVQHLEAIWSGVIVFHTSYDQVHLIRDDLKPSTPEGMDTQSRRYATIYDGRNASLFKLSRLRIPKYRHIFSIIPLGVLLILHIYVLKARSQAITLLEALFWLWSLGFIIDEIADFSESGISLYFMSMWNVFDFTIFVLFMSFYTLRIVGLFVDGGHGYITDGSFDILAACSVFLFPRIFSVLDQYQHFSQLIIAFRSMAKDMVVLLVLIVISCSGFFVAFTFSFARGYASAPDVSYTLFQIVMGYTPAAWDAWAQSNVLGRFLLMMFLVISHFMIVTILITVLTNSFAAVAANAQEEHQFLVAVNTISLVKNEAAFTYITPTNLIAWIIYPLRHVMPFRKFVRLNRTIVKCTHLPLLAAIYFYESTVLRNSVSTSLDAVAGTKPVLRNLKAMKTANGLVNPVLAKARRRESISSQRQEQVLEEVFARPYHRAMFTQRSDVGGNVDSWMHNIESQTPPAAGETFSAIPDTKLRRRGRNERVRAGRMPQSYGTMTRGRRLRPDFLITTPAISEAGDAEDIIGAHQSLLDEPDRNGMRTEDDADNEANSADEETHEDSAAEAVDIIRKSLHHSASPDGIMSVDQPLGSPTRRVRLKHHVRTNSSNTVLFDPALQSGSSNDEGGEDIAVPAVTRPRLINSSRGQFQSVPDLDGLRYMNEYGRRHRSNSDLANLADDRQTVIPPSFASQMANASDSADTMLNRLVLARIGSLEENVKDVKQLLKEVKTMKSTKIKDGWKRGSSN